MKTETLEGHYQKAVAKIAKNPTDRAALVVLELCEEVQRLRALHTKRKAQKNEPLDDDCEIQFGGYKGERLADVPDDYLIWWASEHSKDELQIDAGFAAQPKKAIARMKLRFYDYVIKRLEGGEEPAEEKLLPESLPRTD